MKVTLLGTGTPGPNPDRRQAAVLVEIGEDLLLFDCGRGTLHQMARIGVDLSHLTTLFITHHHFDHISELFDVIITSALSGRTETMAIYGPTGTQEIVQTLVEQVYARDLRSRGEDGRSVNVTCHDVAAGVVTGSAAWRVSADYVKHGDFSDDPEFDWCPLGYRVQADGKVLAISGDTVPCDGITRLAAKADLLIQCCHFPQSVITTDAAGEITTHTLPSSGQVGGIADEANVRHMVLTHLSMQISTAEQIEAVRADIRRDFDGTLTVGEDLMMFEL